MPLIDPEEFVRRWQAAKSVEEVADAMGCTARAASSRAGYYRIKGVPLKLIHPRGRNVDYSALKKLAEDCLKDGKKKCP